MDKLMSNVLSLEEYYKYTQNIRKNSEFFSKNIRLNLSTLNYIRNFSINYEIEYYNQSNNVGAAFLLFKHLLNIELSPKPWNILVKDVKSIFAIWLNAIKNNDISKKWTFLREILECITQVHKKSQVMKAMIVEQFTEDLLMFATNLQFDDHQITCILTCFNGYLLGVERQLRLQHFKKFNEYFIQLAHSIVTSKDYLAQFTIMEVLMKWLVNRQDAIERAQIAKLWFPYPTFCKTALGIFLERPFVNCYADTRDFLNAQNAFTKLIMSFRCDKLRMDNEVLASCENTKQDIWLDLNILRKSLMLHYRTNVTGKRVHSIFQVMTLYEDNIKAAEFKSGLVAILSIETYNPPEFLYKANNNQKVLKTNGNNLLIYIQPFDDNRRFHEVMAEILDIKYKSNYSRSLVEFLHPPGQVKETFMCRSPTVSSICLSQLRENIKIAPNELGNGRKYRMYRAPSLKNVDELAEPQSDESENETNCKNNVETVAQIHTSKNSRTDNNEIVNKHGAKLRNKQDLIALDDIIVSEKSHVLDDDIVRQLYRDASVEPNVSKGTNTEKYKNGLSESTSGHDSVISNTPSYVNARKEINKINNSKDANVLEQFFAQHIRQLDDGGLEISPTLVRRMNETSSESSFDIVDNLGLASSTKVHELEDSELNKCNVGQKQNNVHIPINPIPESSEQLDIVDGANSKTGSQKEKTPAKTKPAINRSKEKATICTPIKKMATKSQKKKPKTPSKQQSKTAHKSDTLKAGKRRSLFSPNNLEPPIADEHNVIDEFVHENQSSKKAPTFYSQLVEERKNLRSLRGRRLKAASQLELSPKRQKINDMFDKIKSSENSNLDGNIVEVTNKNAHDIAVYNFSSDSDDELFKTKKTQSDNVKTNSKGKKKVAFTDENSKTASRKKKRVRKTPRIKLTDKTSIDPLIDEGMREAANNDNNINVSIIDNTDGEVIINETLEPKTLKPPEMETIPEEQEKKIKIKPNVKKTGPNKKNRKKTTNKKKSVLNLTDREASPLPLLVVEAVPENNKIKDTTISSKIIDDMKQFYLDPNDTNNSVNITLLEYDAPKTNNDEHEHIDVETVDASPQTRLLGIDQYAEHIIQVRSSYGGSEKTFATAGILSPINGHGDSNERPPDPKHLNKKESPRNLNLEDLSPPMRDYYTKIHNKINESLPKNNHLNDSSSSDLFKEPSKNNSNQLKNFDLRQSEVVLQRMPDIDTFLAGPKKPKNIINKKKAPKKVIETLKTSSTLRTSSPKSTIKQDLMFDTKNLEAKISPIKIGNSRQMLLQSESTSIASDCPVKRHHDNISNRELVNLTSTIKEHLLYFTDMNLLNNGHILRSKTSSNKSSKESTIESQKPPETAKQHADVNRYFLRSETSSSYSNLSRAENKITTRKRPLIQEDAFVGKRQKTTENVFNATTSTVSQWLENGTGTVEDRDDIVQRYDESLLNIMERLETTLEELNRDTAQKFLKLSVELQNEIRTNKEERLKEFMRLEESFDKRNTAIWKEFNDMFESAILKDVKRKQLMVAILKEDVKNVRKHLLQNH